MPPPSPAELPDRVELFSVAVPLSLKMPPPLVAELPDRVELFSFAVPNKSLSMPPPLPAADLIAQAADAAVVKRVVDGERGQQRAFLQRHQRRPHPPPSPGLDRPPPASSLIPRSVATHGSFAPLVLNNLW